MVATNRIRTSKLAREREANKRFQSAIAGLVVDEEEVEDGDRDEDKDEDDEGDEEEDDRDEDNEDDEEEDDEDDKEEDKEEEDEEEGAEAGAWHWGLWRGQCARWQADEQYVTARQRAHFLRAWEKLRAQLAQSSRRLSGSPTYRSRNLATSFCCGISEVLKRRVRRKRV